MQTGCEVTVLSHNNTQRSVMGLLMILSWAQYFVWFFCVFFKTFSSESQMNQWVIKCNEHNRTSVSYLVSFTILANPGDRKCTIIWQWSTLLTLSEMCSVTVHTNFQLQKMSNCSGTDKMEEAFRTICWSQKEGN